MIKTLFLYAFFAFLIACGDPVNDKYDDAVYKLILSEAKQPEYDVIIKKLGFEPGKTYSYTEYAAIKFKNRLEEAGEYDFLRLSTGGTAWEPEDILRFNKPRCGWEITYLKAHDATVLHEICRSEDRARSFVRILKAVHGRNPMLHEDR